MSPLWNGNHTKQSNRQAKPSPTYNDFFLDSAQDPGKFTNSIKKYLPIKKHSIEETSLLTSDKKDMLAGMTVETALVLPLFLFFLLSFGSVIEMIRLHGNIQLALWEIGKETALYTYAVEHKVMPEEEASWWEGAVEAVLSTTFLKWKMVDTAGEAYLEQSPIVGGSDGLIFWESDIVKPNGEMELVVTYGVESISTMIGLPYFRMANRYYGHAWTGYQLEDVEHQSESELVYIADNAKVYHLFQDCTHLKLSVREILDTEVEVVRNLYGGQYDACEKCAVGNMPRCLYITEEGDCYHYVRECPGLKRTVYTVTIDKAKNLPLCSRCRTREE